MKAWLGLGAALGSALGIAAACAGQPRAVRAPVAALSGPPASSGSAPAQPMAALDVVSLEAFVPLLGLPPLARAAELLEAGNPAAAAEAAGQALSEHPPAAADVPRWQYLLGRLREQAGQPLKAAASFDLAAEGVLADHARLGAARNRLRAGRAREALAALAALVAVPDTLRDERLALVAEAAERVGDDAQALAAHGERFQAYLAEPTPTGAPPAGFEAGALALAERTLALPAPAPAELDRALGAARRLRLLRAPTDPAGVRALAAERTLLGKLAPAERARREPLSLADELLRARTLEAAGTTRPAREALEAALSRLSPAERYGAAGCEVALGLARLHAADKAHGLAADALLEPARRCTDADVQARVLFAAGKHAAADRRHAVALRWFTELERLHPAHRLADDARYHAALAAWELGDEARFTELLVDVASVYPEGDRALDGAFRLALRRMEKGDWSGALSVFDRAAPLAARRDQGRDPEHAGRERYFQARAWLEGGQRDRALVALEALVEEHPLSYYMLQAWTRLSELAPERAVAARERARARAAESPFAVGATPAMAEPGFRRAMELLRVGDLDRGRRELAALGVSRGTVAPEILWGVSLLYARAGSPRLSHGLVRGHLRDWLGRWPSGDWERAWQMAYPRPWRTIVQREATRTGVPEPLVYAVMREESAFDPDAESPAQAYGLMQLIVPTAKLYARKAGQPAWDATALRRPAVNVALGCQALADLTQRFDGQPVLAIPGYNAGPGRPRRWLRELPAVDFDLWVELIPITETRRYLKRVLTSRAAYAVLYHADQAEQALRLPLRLGAAPAPAEVSAAR